MEVDDAGKMAAQVTCGHALLLPLAAQGHITPMLELGKRLVSQGGLLVTVAVADHMHSKLTSAQAAGASPKTPTDDASLRMLGIKAGVPPDLAKKGGVWTEDVKKTVYETLAQSALELVHRFEAEARPVTFVVGDFFSPWTCSVAERAGLPEIVFWPQSAAVFCIYMHVDAIIAAGYNPFEANVKATCSRQVPMELITCIPGLPVGIHPADLPFEGGPFGQTGVDWMHSWLLDRFGCISKAHGVIVNSFEALETDMVSALSQEFQQGRPHPNCWPRTGLRLVGPLVPGAAVGEEEEGPLTVSGSLWVEQAEECMQWLDKQARGSVLFVAFGSMVAMSVKQAQELAFGLVASGQKFLWAIREKAVTPAGEDLLRGWEKAMALEEALPAGFMEENRHVCKVVTWVPQARVLAHPAVGGFFTHCGWNSTLEAFCCGVPILGWPWMVDQVTNCWLATHVWQVGLTLERDLNNHASSEQVESGVRQLMVGQLACSLRARASRIKDLARKAAHGSDGLLSFVQGVSAVASHAQPSCPS